VIHTSHGVQIVVTTKPADLRKGHYGLAALAKSHLKKKPFDGTFLVFHARRANRPKVFW
jgi:transposase